MFSALKHYRPFNDFWLASVWNKLLERSGIDHPFLTHEWISIWWDCFAESATPSS